MMLHHLNKIFICEFASVNRYVLGPLDERDFILSAYGGLSLRSLFHVHVFIHKCSIVNCFQLVADDLHCC